MPKIGAKFTSCKFFILSDDPNLTINTYALGEAGALRFIISFEVAFDPRPLLNTGAFFATKLFSLFIMTFEDVNLNTELAGFGEF